LNCQIYQKKTFRKNKKPLNFSTVTLSQEGFNSKQKVLILFMEKTKREFFGNKKFLSLKEFLKKVILKNL